MSALTPPPEHLSRTTVFVTAHTGGPQAAAVLVACFNAGQPLHEPLVPDGATCTHILLEHGHGDVVRDALPVLSRSLTVADVHGDTPLHVAAKRGDAASCSVLLGVVEETGVDCNARNAAGDTPLMLAAASGHEATCLVLLTHCDTVVHRHAAALAARAGMRRACARMLQIVACGDADAPQRLAEVMMRAAIQKCDTSAPVIEMLLTPTGDELDGVSLDAAALCSVMDESGNTLLMLAIRQRHVQLCLLLLAAGAPVHGVGTETDDEDAPCTTLIMAAHAALHIASVPWYDVCTRIIEAGVDVNAVGFGGCTALMLLMPVQQVHEPPLLEAAVHVCNLMLTAGADIAITSTSGSTALHEGILAFIALQNEASGALMPLTELLLRMLSHSNVREVVNLPFPERDGETLLTAVCKRRPRGADMQDLVRGSLITAGADVNAARADRYTPLLLAARHRQVVACQQLTTAGAELGCTGDDGATVLSSCACIPALEPISIAAVASATVNISAVGKRKGDDGIASGQQEPPLIAALRTRQHALVDAILSKLFSDGFVPAYATDALLLAVEEPYLPAVDVLLARCGITRPAAAAFGIALAQRNAAVVRRLLAAGFCILPHLRALSADNATRHSGASFTCPSSTFCYCGPMGAAA